jgi:hypothetical protein
MDICNPPVAPKALWQRIQTAAYGANAKTKPVPFAPPWEVVP